MALGCRTRRGLQAAEAEKVRVEDGRRVKAQKDKAADGRVAHVGRAGELFLRKLADAVKHAPQANGAQGGRRNHVDNQLRHLADWVKGGGEGGGRVQGKRGVEMNAWSTA